VRNFRVSCSLIVSALVATASGSALAGPSDPDAGFGTGGVVIEDLGSIEAGGTVLQLSTGKLLLVGGGSGTAAAHSFTRYDTNGTKDAGYGTGGTVTGFPGGPVGVTLLAGDELLVAGAVDTGSLTELNDAAVSRYTATGAKDTTFGTGGRSIFRFDPVNPRNEAATDAIELASGKVLVVGWYWKGGTDLDIGVVRLDAAGAIDPTFGDAGRLSFDFGGGSDQPTKVLELPNKKLIVYGQIEDKTAPGQPSKVFFLRLTEDGQVDPTFGGAGTGWKTILTDINSDTPGSMRRLSSGKFLFAVNGTALWTAGRLTEDGTLDSDFGIGGITNLSAVFGDKLFPFPQSTVLAVQSDGRFVMASGIAGVTPQFQLRYDLGLARFEEDGTPDTTFHSGSAQRTYTITETAIEVATSVIVQTDGKIVVGGSWPNGSDDRYMLRVTGDAPTVTTTTSTTTTMPAALCGDVNGDGKVRSSDALATLKAAVGLTTCPLSVCDANGDGKVRSTDALRVLQFAVGGSVSMDCPS
jgi:uncharacterized delta-60 repeat protein